MSEQTAIGGEEFIKAVSQAVGYGPGAWDLVAPKILVAAILERSAISQWQTIDTAPKSEKHEGIGPDILAFEGGAHYVCWWSKWQKAFVTDSDVFVSPTHWMPLPEPPNEA